MLIDWFTVGAQALNFVVLVWLMKRFLYKPVQDAIAEREKRIAGELADADRKKAEAVSDRDDLRRKSDAFDEERAALLKKATDDANTERERLLDAAGRAADAATAKRQAALDADADRLGRGLRRRVQNEVFAIARKTLADLASASLDERLCEAFTMRLRAVDEDAKTRLAAAFASQGEPPIVRSAFELPAAQRAAVEKAVHETFPTKAALQFETAPELVGGIELGVGGLKIAWSIADHLTSLEREVAELLKSHAAPPVAARTAGNTPARAPTETAPATGTVSPTVVEPAPS